VSSVARFFGLDIGEALDAIKVELRYDAKPRTTGHEVGFVAATPRPALCFRPPVEDALARAWSSPLSGELA
jgi:hypothetical protein